MPYQLQGPPPIPSPWFFEPPIPYPHWYRYGPDYSRAMFRSESSEGAWVRRPTTVLSGLGDDYTVPWQCWDQPGFKDCQKRCYDAAAADKTIDVTKCFKTSCVDPCAQHLDASGSGGASSATSWLSSLSPQTLALGAVGIAVVVAVVRNKKSAKRRGRR